MSGKISTRRKKETLSTKHYLAIEKELFQAAHKKINELNKLGVAQGRTDISEPEQQHLPVLVDLGDFENWLKDAESYVIDKRLKRDEEKKFGGKKIDVEDILKDITARGELVKKCSSVMVLAPAGMGKTTLLRRIAQNVKRGEYKELEGKLVLMLDFRPHLKGKKLLPSQVLLGDMFSDWGSERMKQRYQWIIDNPEKVVFVIDSLDTLSFDLDKDACQRPRNRPEYHKAATADVILRNILAKDWFAESIIISSSREYKVRNLHPSFRPDRCILLDGLTEESVQDLIDGFLGKVRGEEVKNYIKTECPDVWPLLSIPVVLVFSMIGFVEDGFKPKTLSGILIKFFQNLIRSSHAHVENVLIVFNKLLPLAFEGTRTLCVLFTPEYMKRFGLEPEEVTDLGALIPQSQGTFLSTKLMQNDGFLLYFNHQTEQKALAALHVMSLFLAEFKTFMEGEVWEQQFTVVRRLIFGTLLNDEVLEAAQDLTEISDVDQKKIILIRSLDVALEKYQRYDGDNMKLLELFMDLSECREEGVTELIRSSVKNINFCLVTLSPSDVQAVAFMMKQCEYLEEVNLSACHLNDEKMKILSKTIEQSNVKFEKFDVGVNKKLGVEGAHLLGKLVRNHEVKDLVARDGSIQGCEALKKFNEGLGDAKLKIFDVSGNKRLGVEGAHLLGKLVRNREVEDLNAGGKSIQGCEALKKFIEGLGDAKLEVFDIRESLGLGPEGAHLLGKMVKNHQAKKSLRAGDGTIHDRVSVEKFIEGLGDAKIDYLDLSAAADKDYTDCPQPLIRSLLDLLPHVENELAFMSWKINESQQQELQQKLNEISSPSLKVIIGGINMVGETLFPTTLKASLMDSTSGQLEDHMDSEVKITCKESDDESESATTSDEGNDDSVSATTSDEGNYDSVSVATSEESNDVAEMETETSDEASTSGTGIVLPSGASVALEKYVLVRETKPESTISEKKDAGCGAVETDETAAPEAKKRKLEPSDFEKETAKFHSMGSNEAIKTIYSESIGQSSTCEASTSVPSGTSFASDQLRDETKLESTTTHEEGVDKLGAIETGKLGGHMDSEVKITFKESDDESESETTSQESNDIAEVKTDLLDLYTDAELFDLYTDLLDETTGPGASVTADESTQSQKEAEQDNAAGSVVGDERIQIESTGVSHVVTSERNPVIQIPCITTQEELISRACGGKIKSGNCKVKFSSGLLKHDAKIKITVKSGDVSDRPKQGIPISPTLGCDLSHVGIVPGSEMKVEILAYCFASKPVPIALLSKASDSEDWEIEKELMLGRDRKVKFKTSSFSHKLLVFMRQIGLGRFLNFVVIPQLYYDELGTFSSYLSVDDKSIINEIKTAHISDGFASALVKPEEIHAKLGEFIRLELQCEHPQTASFGDNNNDKRVSDELIDKTYVKKDFTLRGITDQVDGGFIEIHFTLAKEPPERPPNPMKRRLKWPKISNARKEKVNSPRRDNDDEGSNNKASSSTGATPKGPHTSSTHVHIEHMNVNRDAPIAGLGQQVDNRVARLEAPQQKMIDNEPD